MNPLMINTFIVLGGLGLFLFGMKIMSTGLEAIAGDRLQGFLQKATSNRFLGVFVGIGATIMLNSSTASTVMTVSFVNSGLMNLQQAIGIILGANVGTTLSAQLIAFRVDQVAPAFIFIGAIMYMFIKDKRSRDIGYVVLGFGVLFFGISTMSGPLRTLASEPGFYEILTSFQNPVLALLAGFLFTAAVQSSTAATGILVMLYLNGVPIPFETGAFIILGTNIGTSTTTLIASIPASRESKRAAVFHITFDIIGSAVFGTLIFFIPAILGWFELTWAEPARQIAMFHTLYNIATMALLLPFVKPVAKLMEVIIPVQPDDTDETYDKKLLYMDTKIKQPITVAMYNAHQEVCRMGKIASENLNLALEAFFEHDTIKATKALKREDVINYLNQNIAAKLVRINNKNLPPAVLKKIGVMFRTITDIERIGDHAENIAEFAIAAKEGSLKFSDAAVSGLKQLADLTTRITNEAINIYESQNTRKLDMIKSMEDEIDELSTRLTENHIARLTNEACDPRSGVVFTDMINDLERTGDHANNIAFAASPNSEAM